MTLQELLRKYTFDELMGGIESMFDGTEKYREPLKHAYTLLSELNPVFSKKSIRYHIITDEENEEEYMGAEDRCFQTTWEVCLGKEVIVEKDVELSELEIAANCLVNLCLIGRYPKSFEASHQQLLS